MSLSDFDSNQVHDEEFLDQQIQEPKKNKKAKINEDPDEEWLADQEYYLTQVRDKQTRQKSKEVRTMLIDQLNDDPILALCVDHQYFIDYLVEHHYTDVYQYVKECNRKGVLLDYAIKKYYNQKIILPNYERNQIIGIHQKNRDQYLNEQLQKEIQELKLKKTSQKKTQNSSITKFFTQDSIQIEQEQRILQQESQKIQQQQNMQKKLKSKQNHKNQQHELIQSQFQEDIFQQEFLNFLQFQNKVIQEFDVVSKKIKEQNEQNEVDYDNLSDDSLTEQAAIHPRNRDKSQWSQAFQITIQPIQIINLSCQFK